MPIPSPSHPLFCPPRMSHHARSHTRVLRPHSPSHPRLSPIRDSRVRGIDFAPTTTTDGEPTSHVDAAGGGAGGVTISKEVDLKPVVMKWEVLQADHFHNGTPRPDNWGTSRPSFGFFSLDLGYSLLFTEALLAPAIPSVLAHTDDIFLPLVRHAALAPATARSAGLTQSWLMLTCFQTSVVSSAMFLTAMVAKSLSPNLTTATIGQGIGWKL
ncbi:hypothetical protein ZEAMMB73_Zm00001d052924 [Zea mays]|uniref:Uncharacterized protein n=4 Tax=Zea mays TaxID=4577 RepID=A0A1D6QKX4_MAIZE|nr:hypothetical protein ZEAMMB73_Zm00001d052924 [Zea mays]